jgi:hypothetical protein
MQNFTKIYSTLGLGKGMFQATHPHAAHHTPCPATRSFLLLLCDANYVYFANKLQKLSLHFKPSASDTPMLNVFTVNYLPNPPPSIFNITVPFSKTRISSTKPKTCWKGSSQRHTMSTLISRLSKNLKQKPYVLNIFNIGYPLIWI